METRANHVWVGAVSLLILGALALFIVWLARLGGGAQDEYDIFFKQSVSGLANGSGVDFSGVPVGQVTQIELWDKDPEFVRVRIKVKDTVPILVGTTATIQGSFTGVSTITLDGARTGAPPISCETTACTEGVPIIPPTAGGGFGAVLASAPLLLERLATLTERLTVLLSDRNQEQISQILANANAASAGFADLEVGGENGISAGDRRRTVRPTADLQEFLKRGVHPCDSAVGGSMRNSASWVKEAIREPSADHTKPVDVPRPSVAVTTH